MVYRFGAADLVLLRRDEPTIGTELIELLRELSH